MQKIFKIATVCIALFVATTFAGGTIGDSFTANAKSKSSTAKSITTKQVVNDYSLNVNKPLTVYYSLNYSDYSNHTEYFKVKPSKTGRITVSSSNIYTSNIYLCDSNKKVISSKNNFSTCSSLSYYRQINYGVKKGKTYYIKICKMVPINEKSAYPYTNFNYTIKYTNTNITEKSGTKKSKAKKIKYKKYRYGAVQAASGTADWYKFYNNKRKIRKITYKGKTNARLRITIYYKWLGRTWSEKRYIEDFNNYKSSATKIFMYRGNVYIKVERMGKGSSGSYGIKWQ